MGTITSDLLCCIALLNSLSSHFPHACSIISHNIAAATVSAPYTSKDICLFLENEQMIHEIIHLPLHCTRHDLQARKILWVHHL
ncbi:hypothetical protein L208DRAFT_1509451 [Tricholoma matsutake]|nr:hypothetical protein L208DRAFT_1509451 [Tricholoma matsutake 945]